MKTDDFDDYYRSGTAGVACTFEPNCFANTRYDHSGCTPKNNDCANATTKEHCCSSCEADPGCAAGVFDGATSICSFKTAEDVERGCDYNSKSKVVACSPPGRVKPPSQPRNGADITCPNTTQVVNHSKTVVVAVGDSITFGWTCKNWSAGFVRVLQTLLPSDQYEVRDCGVMATTAVHQQHAGHPSYWETAQFEHSRAMKPDVVLFMLGTNDALEWGPQLNDTKSSPDSPVRVLVVGGGIA